MRNFVFFGFGCLTALSACGEAGKQVLTVVQPM